MKKNWTKLTSAFLAVIMVFLMLPLGFVISHAEDAEYTYIENDYTPFLIENASGNSVYNSQTAYMCYKFYCDARDYIDDTNNNIGESLLPTQGNKFSFEYNGNIYIPESTYASKPKEYPSCGLFTGIINYKVGDKVKHVALIAFRGTKGVDDIITDLAFATDSDDGYHYGFEGAAEHHYQQLSTEVRYSLGDGTDISFTDYIDKMSEGDEEYTMIVTGHSLGGAVAGIFTSKFLGEENNIADKNAVAYTFASPLTCAGWKARSSYVTNIFNFVNTDDIVTQIGARITEGYRLGQDLQYKLNRYKPLVKEKVIAWLIAVASDIPLYVKRGLVALVFAEFQISGEDYLNNHHMGTAYEPLLNHVNANMDTYTNSFVLYNNYDETTGEYQRIVYSNGQLIVSGMGTLSGDWKDHTNINFARMQNRVTALSFDNDCNISEIGISAFAGMSGLANQLTLPDSLTTIGEYAFYMCGFNGELRIPDGMLSVGQYAFYGCSKLDVINASGATSMNWGYGAFANCVNRDYLNLPGVNVDYDVFGVYHVQDKNGYISRIVASDRLGSGANLVLPGDKITLGRLTDLDLSIRPYQDYFYFLTTEDITTNTLIKDNATKTIEGVASVSEDGVITIDDNCLEGVEFTVLLIERLGGDTPDFDRSRELNEKMGAILFTVAKSNAVFEGGAGTAERPYLIKNAEQFKAINKNLDKHFKLINDIDFEGENLSMMGTLTGGLDGNGCSIYNFKINGSNKAALFDEIAEGASIKNITVGEVVEEKLADNWVRIYSVEIQASVNSSGAKAGTFAIVNRGTIENCLVHFTKVSAAAGADFGSGSTIETLAGGYVAENCNEIKKCNIMYSDIFAASTTPADKSPARCNAFSGGFIGVNRTTEAGKVFDVSSAYNHVYADTYTRGDGWLADDGFGNVYAGGIISYCVSASVDGNSCYSYQNGVHPYNNADKGESKSRAFIATGAGETSACIEEERDFNTHRTSIEIAHAPHKTHYYVGEELNLYGLRVTDQNGNPLNGYTVSGYSSQSAKTQTITVSYGGEKAEFTVTVENIIPVEIVISVVGKWSVNSTINASNLKATIYYNNGDVETLDNLADYTSQKVTFVVDEYTLSEVGTNIIKVRYLYIYNTEEGTGEMTRNPIDLYTMAESICECGDRILINVSDASYERFGYTGDHICTVCGSLLEKGEVIGILEKTGDVNGDGKVNVLDIVLIRRYIEGGYEVDSIDAIIAADVNGDGNVDMDDVEMIRQHLAGGYGVEIGGVTR